MLAAELGYEPNSALSALVMRRWSRRDQKSQLHLAYLSYAKSGPDKAHLHHMTEDARHHAKKHGYTMEVLEAAELRDIDQLPALLRQRGVQGCIIGPMLRPDRLEDLDWEGMAVVRCGGGRFDVELDCVRIDYGRTVEDACRRAHVRGYRRFGAMLYRHDPLAIDDLACQGGYAAAELQWGGEMEFAPIFWMATGQKQRGRDSDFRKFRAWFRQYQPDVVLVFNSAGYYLLERAGLEVPQQVAMINLRRGAASSGLEEISGYYQHHDALLQTAVELVDQKIRTGDLGSPMAGSLKRTRRTIHCDMRWVEGATFPTLID